MSLGQRQVLEDIALDVPQCGIFVLMGAPAAGKSTLLRALAGVADPPIVTRGTALFNGLPLREGPAPMLISGDLRLPDQVTLDDFLAEGLAHLSFSSAGERRDLVEALLLEFGLLGGRLDREMPVTDLQPGVQRRLAVARALAARPSLLMLDELTKGLETAERHALLDLVLRAASGRGVLYATRNLSDARVLGGTIGRLASGRLDPIQPAGELFRQPPYAGGEPPSLQREQRFLGEDR